MLWLCGTLSHDGTSGERAFFLLDAGFSSAVDLARNAELRISFRYSKTPESVSNDTISAALLAVLRFEACIGCFDRRDGLG